AISRSGRASISVPTMYLPHFSQTSIRQTARGSPYRIRTVDESVRMCGAHHRHRFRQPTAFIQLDIDPVETADEPVNVQKTLDTLSARLLSTYQHVLALSLTVVLQVCLSKALEGNQERHQPEHL